MVSILNISTKNVLKIERSISELRRGFVVSVKVPNTKTQPLLVLAADTASEEILQTISANLSCPVYLVLSAKRVHRLFPDIETHHKPAKLPLPTPINVQHLYLLSGLDFSSSPSFFNPSAITPATELEAAALELVKLAELLPAAIVLSLPESIKNADLWLQEQNILSVEPDEIEAFKKANAESLAEVCTAPLCLEGAEDASIRVYRPTLGGNEHYAIIIGTALKDKAPLVRIHSSCYTGDLLRSLRCDCGDQLHEAIHFMGEKAIKAQSDDSGGIIIYLMQEGRGIGLTNKLRAYDLQATGMDTVDANETLGFDDDERLFLPAVKILEKLGIHTIRLLTNNPKKAKGLEEYGIQVESCVPHIMQAHKHNEAYLETKAKRLGHALPLEGKKS